MASTGFQSPGSATGTETSTFYQSVSAANDVGFLKLGGIIDFANSVAGYAVRQKTVSFNVNVATQTAIAHGCVDSQNNPITPVLASIKYSNSATVHLSADYDATNIYLTDANGATTAATGEVVVFY